MPAFRESLEILCSYLKVIGCLYILRPHRLVPVLSEGACDDIQQSRQNRW